MGGKNPRQNSNRNLGVLRPNSTLQGFSLKVSMYVHYATAVLEHFRSAISKPTTEFAQPLLSRVKWRSSQREGTNLGVFVPTTSHYVGVRLQIWVCLICVISPFSNGAVQIHQKNPRVRKSFVRNSGAGNGCVNFMDAWKSVLYAGKNHVHKIPRFRGGGVFWVLGAGGECRFYFYGRADFLNSVVGLEFADQN